ncbi:MAG: hypothetical protein ACRERE_39725 [Candidatus Entotheonellia bacterium]
MTPSAETARPLPAQRAFVVQFSAQTNVELGQFAGRVEHVVSGYARHFQALDELLASLVQMLVTLGAEDAEGGADAPPR